MGLAKGRSKNLSPILSYYTDITNWKEIYNKWEKNHQNWVVYLFYSSLFSLSSSIWLHNPYLIKPYPKAQRYYAVLIFLLIFWLLSLCVCMRVCEFATLLSFFHSSNVDKVNAYFIFSLSFLPSWKVNTSMSVCLPIYLYPSTLQRFVEIILISHKMLCKTNLFFLHTSVNFIQAQNHTLIYD